MNFVQKNMNANIKLTAMQTVEGTELKFPSSKYKTKSTMKKV